MVIIIFEMKSRHYNFLFSNIENLNVPFCPDWVVITITFIFEYWLMSCYFIFSTTMSETCTALYHFKYTDGLIFIFHVLYILLVLNWNSQSEDENPDRKFSLLTLNSDDCMSSRQIEQNLYNESFAWRS